MTYEEFIKCKSILNEVNYKIEKIESYGFDTNDIKVLRDKLNNDINNSLESINTPSFTNNTNSNKQLLKKEKTNNSNLLESVIDYDKIINKYLNSFKIIDEYKLIEKELTDDITITKLNNILDKLFVLISNYKELKDTGYENIEEKEIYALLYKIIKMEFRIKDRSILLKFLLYNYDYIYNDLLELVNQDIEKYINNKDIYKRFNEIISYEDLDETMIYLLSMNENNQKEKVFNEVIEANNNLLKAKQEYETLKNSKNKQSIYKDEAKDIKKHMKKAIIINSLCKIMAVLALFGIIKGSQTLKNNSKNYNTTMEVYDTLLPDTDYTNEYTDYSENQVIVTDYKIPTEDNFMDANIKINQYVFDYDGRDLEDYANLDFDNLTPTNSNLINNLDGKEKEHTVVKLVKNIDYEDKYSSTGEFIETVGLSILVPAEILLALLNNVYDFRISDENKYHVTPSVLSILTKYPYKNLKFIIDDLKEISKLLENKENGVVYNKENLKLLKKKINELERQYNEILDSYQNIEVLAHYNDKTLELGLK